jgi:Protein of unknown function (DUF1552)
MPSNTPLDRREFMRRFGAAAVFYPLFRNVRAQADGTALNRVAFLFWPNGAYIKENLDDFFPKGNDRTFTLSPVLRPFEPVRDECVFFRNIHYLGGIQGGHGRGLVGYMTGWDNADCVPNAKCNGDLLISKKASVDQIIRADLIRRGVAGAIPSLELGVDHAIDPKYQSYMSFRENGVPVVARYGDPTKAFKDLLCTFAKPALSDATKSQADTALTVEHARRRSVLDFVGKDLERMRKKLGPDFSRNVDAQATAVRELEIRLSAQTTTFDTAQIDEVCKAGVDPLANPLGMDFFKRTPASPMEDVARKQIEVACLAFSTGLTRVLTLQFGTCFSDRMFRWLAGNYNHHAISHFVGVPDCETKYRAINTWHMEQFAYFVYRLKQLGGTENPLLDSSLIGFKTLRSSSRARPEDSSRAGVISTPVGDP